MILFFLIVAFISFMGSLHPGTVNLAVIQTTLGQSRRAGVWLALGGSLPEMAYSVLAAGGLMLLPMSSQLGPILEIASIPILLGMGLASIRSKPVVVLVSETAAQTSRKTPFWKGLALAGTNPQLLPYWSAVWLYLNQRMLVPASGSGSQWVFALATSAGAFMLLISLVWLADRQRQRVAHYLNSRWYHVVSGGLFVGMAVVQLVHLAFR